MPQAGSSTVSVFFGSTTSTMKSMMWRGVRNWPASPCEPRTESRYSKASPRRSLMVVGELVDDLEEALKRLGVAIGQIGVLEDVAEEQRDAGILRHLGDAFGVKVQHLVATEARSA